MKIPKLKDVNFIFFDKGTRLDNNIVNSIKRNSQKISQSDFLKYVSESQILTVISQYQKLFVNNDGIDYYKSKIFKYDCFFFRIVGVEYFFINSKDQLDIKQLIKFGTPLLENTTEQKKLLDFVVDYATEWSHALNEAYRNVIKSNSNIHEFNYYKKIIKESRITQEGIEKIQQNVHNNNSAITADFKWYKILGLASGINEKAVPKNKELWDKAIAAAKRKFDVYPSRYANWWASDYYKKQGGKFK